MAWYPDDPGLKIPKPPALEWLETQGDDMLNAMDPFERDKRIKDAAYELAKNYKKQPNSNYRGCVDLVDMALSISGSSLPGKTGSHMVAKSLENAKNACRLVFPDDIIGDISGEE